MSPEFNLIQRYFTHATSHTLLGVGDDAALLNINPENELVVSTDMLVAGQHFFSDTDPEKLGHKSLAVNLSDIVAMGATPRWFTLALALPSVDETWLEKFSYGMMTLAREYDVDLIGGDTTRGPLTICIQIMGEVSKGQALRRDGAKIGDEIWVSGELGDAALALAHLQNRVALKQDELDACFSALYIPQPRIALGLALRGLATAAIDISDGLLADLGHILERSNVGASIELERIPHTATLTPYLDQALGKEALLAGGDDYELCFTAPAMHHQALQSLAQSSNIRLTSIGKIEKEEGFRVLDATGQPMEIKHKGFDHFG